MKARTIFVLVACLTLAAAPAMADLYNNGPINGTTDAWTINHGFVGSDTFTVSDSPITGLSFGTWMFPGDTLTSAEVSITSQENGGTSFFDQVVNFSQSACTSNQFGWNICTETGSFNTTLAAGSYWLNLQNASVADGDPVYWDENSGPSSASENAFGTIPSEAFTIQGSNETGTTGTTGTTPEPGSILLLGSGILGLAGVVRRKFSS